MECVHQSHRAVFPWEQTFEWGAFEKSQQALSIDDLQKNEGDIDLASR